MEVVVAVTNDFMKKVHIALLGREVAPVYNAIMATSPDYIVYIHSDSVDSIKAFESLRREVGTDFESHILSPTNPFDIKRMTKGLAEKFNADNVTVNITSGLKSWAYWFSVIFEKLDNAAIIYIDQNNTIWNYSTMEKVEYTQFDMRALFRLYGNSIDGNFVDFNDYTVKDKEVVKDIEEIRKFNFVEFNALATVLTKEDQLCLKNSKSGTFVTRNCSTVEWEKPGTDEENGRVCVCILKKDGRVKTATLESPHAIELFFNSGWFEYKIADIMSRWSKAKEVYMNCHFPFRPGVDKNEVDIIVNTGSKVLFVECKTQIYNTVDLDKFRSVVKTYGGMGSKGLFITDAVMKPEAVQKCDENAILHFSLQQPTLIPADMALYMLLDSELYNINAR